jgi:hypothetical protein
MNHTPIWVTQLYVSFEKYCFYAARGFPKPHLWGMQVETHIKFLPNQKYIDSPMYFHPMNSLTALNRIYYTEPITSAHFKWFFSPVLYGSLMPIIGHGFFSERCPC